jgi:hypothetical protein
LRREIGMEFFRYLDSTRPAEWLDRLGIADLPACCASIDRVLSVQGDRGVIYCLWGEFEVRREAIRGGVRFTLPHCPNALAWTITAERTPRGAARITLHCTINRETHEADFVESIHHFMDDWQRGLDNAGIAVTAC